MVNVLFSSPHSIPWNRQFPRGTPVWNGWKFIFDHSDNGRYDYLVAFDDLRFPTEPRCLPENTLHIATEPPTITKYKPGFLRQFGTIVNFHPNVSHPHVVAGQPGINWRLGWVPETGDESGAMSFESMQRLFSIPRTKTISIIISNKAFTAGHAKRLEFAHRLKAYFGDRLDFFGRGFAEIDDKLDALKGYRFHVALENSYYPHYFTEKIGDPIIAGCYPLYYGCPNLEEYLPADSFSRIDINDLDGSIAVIEEALRRAYDVDRRQQLFEARQKIMYEHNVFAMVQNLLSSHAAGAFGETRPPCLVGFRRFFRKRKFLLEKNY